MLIDSLLLYRHIFLGFIRHIDYDTETSLLFHISCCLLYTLVILRTQQQSIKVSTIFN